MDLLNKVMVVGNLTRDPEVRETGNGKAVAQLGLAIDSGSSGRSGSGGGGSADPEPVYLEVVLWERNAENAGKYLKKGSCILLEGRLQMDTWQDKQSGQTRRKLKVVGDRIRFLNLATRGEEQGQARRQPAMNG